MICNKVQLIKRGLEKGQLDRAMESERIKDATVPLKHETWDDRKGGGGVAQLPEGEFKEPKNPSDWNDPAYDQPISKYFYLRDLTQCNYSKYPLKAQCGLSIMQIIARLSNLAKTVLDPLVPHYGGCTFKTYGRKGGVMILSSGFRSPCKGSWHTKGCAIDVQFSDIRPGDYCNRAENVAKLIPGFDAIILEYNDRSQLLHLQARPDSARGLHQTARKNGTLMVDRTKFVNLIPGSRTVA